MGALTSVITPLFQIGSVLGSVAGMVQPYVSDKQERKQQQQTQALLLRQAQQDAALQKEQQRITTEQSDSQRRTALKRAMARQRANFGAQGVGSDNGSSEAVLLGMFSESDEERANREKIDALRTQAIDQNIGQRQQLNLLQQTQLREKQYVDYLSRF